MPYSKGKRAWLGAVLFPTIVAVLRWHHNKVAIFLLNALLGWFWGIGWVAALI